MHAVFRRLPKPLFVFFYFFYCKAVSDLKIYNHTRKRFETERKKYSTFNLKYKKQQHAVTLSLRPTLTHIIFI